MLLYSADTVILMILLYINKFMHVHASYMHACKPRASHLAHTSHFFRNKVKAERSEQALRPSE